MMSFSAILVIVAIAVITNKADINRAKERENQGLN
jgi:hypothetical protein